MINTTIDRMPLTLAGQNSRRRGIVTRTPAGATPTWIATGRPGPGTQAASAVLSVPTAGPARDWPRPGLKDVAEGTSRQHKQVNARIPDFCR